MNAHSKRNPAQWQAISDPWLNFFAASHPVGGPQPMGRKDVSLLTIVILEERDSRRPIRVVFDADYGSLHVVFLALEIDDPIHPLVAAAPKASTDHAVEVAPAFFTMRDEQCFFRLLLPIGELGKIADRSLAAAC